MAGDLLQLPARQYDTKADMVHQVLRENIVNGHLKPGTRLILKKLADELGVSEIPVREAIRRLQAEGLVAITPHSGAEVTALQPDELAELLAIRGVLEGFAARTAVKRVSAAVIAELKALLEEMLACAEQGDNVTYGVLNRDFHRRLYAHSPYQQLLKMIRELWVGGERSRAVFQLNPARVKASYAEHRAILVAVEAGDEDGIESLVRLHRAKAGQALMEYDRGGDG